MLLPGFKPAIPTIKQLHDYWGRRIPDYPAAIWTTYLYDVSHTSFMKEQSGVDSTAFGLLHGVRWFETDVSGLDFGLILLYSLNPQYRIGDPETSVSSPLMPRNNPEDGIIQFEHDGSL